jgi:hypothetical protein
MDQVYHVAGLTRAREAREFFRVNDEGTRRLVHACLETPRGPRRLVHLSSLAAVGPMAMATACDEDTVPRPVSAYGWSKLQGEAAVLGVRDRLHVTVLRPPVVYGPRDRGVLEVVRWVARGFLPMPAGPSRSLSLCYIRDLVTALLTAGEAKFPLSKSSTWLARGSSRGSRWATPWARPWEYTPHRCGSLCRFSSLWPRARTRGRGSRGARAISLAGKCGRRPGTGSATRPRRDGSLASSPALG